MPTAAQSRLRLVTPAAITPARDGASDVELHAKALRDDPLYLDRCQVDTPTDIVALLWKQVLKRRRRIDLVVDFGAGDGKFAKAGRFDEYLGYEVDSVRCADARGAANVRIVPKCAFSHREQNANVCVGNPPYVRNQDLPSGWREMAAEEVRARTGVSLSGLANAWQYFFMLALWTVKRDGLVAQVLPYEWVSRPAAAPIREFIDESGWSVDVYRLPDGVFSDVVTAASITIVDKRGPAGWRFHDMDLNGELQPLASATGALVGVLPYTSVRNSELPRTRRGLSPGTQQVLTLTEGERVHAGLHVTRDVVRCVTSLRSVPAKVTDLSSQAFHDHLVAKGAKCWLIRTDREPSPRMKRYLDSIDEALYQTATCLDRDIWWQFPMPQETPTILIAQAFKGASPKAVVNEVKAHAVGGVAGIYNLDAATASRFTRELSSSDLRDRLVPYAKQMQKLEVNQINSLVARICEGSGDA